MPTRAQGGCGRRDTLEETQGHISKTTVRSGDNDVRQVREITCVVVGERKTETHDTNSYHTKESMRMIIM